MAEPTSFLNVEYMVYNSNLRTRTIVRESPDSPDCTEIIHREDGYPDARVLVDSKDIPLLIEALKRRYADSMDERLTR